MTVTLGLYAIPFGFGPVSKAITIARSLSKIMDIEWYMMGSGISLEYMKREGLTQTIIETSPTPEDAVVDEIRRKLDGAIVLMDNGMASRLAPHIPVFFADSLGFMWNKDDFSQFPGMTHIKKYYVQNLFGAYEHMLATEQVNLAPVPPIVDIRASARKAVPCGKDVLHLGGLLNPMNRDTTKIYLGGIRNIVSEMNLESPILLMSRLARDAFPDITDGLDCRDMAHANALGVIAASAFTWSSPGLTTLLEMAELETATCPLPPQNYSQALNIRNLVRTYGDCLDETWHFLDHEYRSIVPGMPEEDGVRTITALNATKLSEPGFISTFSKLSLASRRNKTRLPSALKFDRNGSDIIAHDIKAYFEAAMPSADGERIYAIPAG